MCNFFSFLNFLCVKSWMSIKLMYRSVQPTQYTQWKWSKTAQNNSIFACFLPCLGLFVRKMPTARFGHLLISRACDIIKLVGLKRIISYGKVQANSYIWHETLPFGESGLCPINTPTDWNYPAHQMRSCQGSSDHKTLQREKNKS